MKTIVISASASEQEKIKKWCDFWQSRGYEVIAYPKSIKEADFNSTYPTVHREFYKCLAETDFHFIANEEKKGISGYIGPGVFAEIAFRVGLNLVKNQSVPVLLLTTPSKEVKFCEDIKLWISLGWVKLLGALGDF